MVDYIQPILWILGIACSALGWFARQMWSAVQELKRDMNDMRLLISDDYVRYDRLKDAMRPVMESLQEIKQTLAGKADK